MDMRWMRLSKLAATLVAVLAALGLGGCAAEQPAGTRNLERAITLLQIQSHSPDPATRANCVEALQPSSDPRAAGVIVSCGAA